MNNLPIFESIAKNIEDKIIDGTYNVKQKLPSEYELAKEYEVSRLTIRKAIDVLVRKNIVVKERGKGTYPLNQQEKIQSGYNGLVSFTESAKKYGKEAKSKILISETLKELPDSLLDKLSIESNQEIYHLSRVRYFDDTPMTIEDIYIPLKHIKHIDKHDLEQSLFTILEQTTDISYSHQEIEAILVTNEVSTLLNRPIGDPLLKTNTLTFSSSGIPLFYDESLYRADKYTFKSILHRN